MILSIRTHVNLHGFTGGFWLAFASWLDEFVDLLSQANGSQAVGLGWGSAALTAVLHTRQQRTRNEQAQQEATNLSWLETLTASVSTQQPSSTAVSSNPPNTPSPTLTLHPDLALALLKKRLVSVGRVWLLLRHLDGSGRGWLDESWIRQQLTQQKATWRLCGWRQLRNLLHRGEGLFWQRRNGRLWLRSLPKVAHALGVQRFWQQPVTLAVKRLTAGLGQLRAHLYASFHSSRSRNQKPIARDTLTDLSSLHKRTQRRYEKKAGVTTQANYACGAQLSPQASEEAGWQRGKALFVLKDVQGRLGNKNGRYLVWQLPNSYGGPHKRRRRQKRLNQTLTDLWHQGTTGNGGRRFEKRFCANGRLAATVASREGRETYWSKQEENGRCRWWHPVTP